MVWIIAFLALLSIILAILFLWKRSKSKVLITSFKSGNFCYPCASPIDAQWGTVTYIAAWANRPNAQRRFVFWNTTNQVMTVRSFTFGGYQRKFRGQVTEMIAPNLMSQYGYSNVIQPGQVFSLDPENDAHVMYKGWYNSPIFIAYALGEENLKYEVVGWAPMRLQDEKTKYKYFYDSKLKDEVKRQAKKLKMDVDDVKDSLGVTKTYTMARNAAIHWKTGSGYGKATYVKPISNDENSQCRYVTELNTFDSVNVHVPLCNITVDFGNMSNYLKDVENRAQCLRNIAIIGSSKIMDSAADLDNFIEPPDFDYGGLIADITGLAVYYYLEIAQTVATTVVTLINTVVPGSGLPLGIFVTALFTLYRLWAVGASQLAGLLPGVGDELKRAGMTAAGFGESDWVQKTQTISGAFFAMARGGIAAAGANAAQSGSSVISSVGLGAAKGAAVWGVIKAGGLTASELQEKANELGEIVVEKTVSETSEIYLAMMTQLVPKAKFKGKGKDDWELGSSGEDKYALDRKLWVNKELQKGKFTKDARCTGLWKVEYHGS